MKTYNMRYFMHRSLIQLCSNTFWLLMIDYHFQLTIKTWYSSINNGSLQYRRCKILRSYLLHQLLWRLKMGMLYLKLIKQLHKLCLLFILSLQFCIIESYYNDGRFSHHGIPLLSFDTHLQNSLNGAKASIFPLSSSDNLLPG